MAGLLFILSAPSGSGKSTLVSQLRSMVPNLDFSVSYTTRAPRGSEQEGREYHFIQRDQFQGMIAGDEFLEHADVFGNFYGTNRASLAEAAARGNDLLLDIDVQGAAQVRKNMPEAISIFILPPNPDVLERRLRNRSRAEGGVEESVVQNVWPPLVMKSKSITSIAMSWSTMFWSGLRKNSAPSSLQNAARHILISTMSHRSFLNCPATRN